MLLSPKKLLAFRRDSAARLAVFLLLTVFLPRASHAGFFAALTRLFTASPAEVEEVLSVFGPAAPTAVAASALFAESRPPGGEDDDGGGMMFTEANAVAAPLNPAGVAAPDGVPPAGQIFLYTVRPGDTITGIARSFDVSVNTIRWANSIPEARALKVGDQIVILPVSGVRHEVKRGETVGAIAKRYRAAVDEILAFNGLGSDDLIAAGATLIIPNGELVEAVPLAPSRFGPRAFVALPQYAGYYLRPIVGGRRSRGIHGYNGVDLAASCGLPVLASADGQVLIARSSGWNGGYGRYAVIAHANSTQTLYAHLRELAVAAGQVVRQGEPIGAIGSSGNSTGCHVHLEIRGARNPF